MRCLQICKWVTASLVSCLPTVFCGRGQDWECSSCRDSPRPNAWRGKETFLLWRSHSKQLSSWNECARSLRRGLLCVAEAPAPVRKNILTARETKVLVLITKGLSTKKIA